MLLTPTLFGSLLAGVACWLLFWFGISHLDSIPYLGKYMSKDAVLKWIVAYPLTALLVTEVVNVMFHGLGTAGAVFFTFAGTITNVCIIFAVIPLTRAISSRLIDKAEAIASRHSTINVPAKEVA